MDYRKTLKLEKIKRIPRKYNVINKKVGVIYADEVIILKLKICDTDYSIYLYGKEGNVFFDDGFFHESKIKNESIICPFCNAKLNKIGSPIDCPYLRERIEEIVMFIKTESKDRIRLLIEMPGKIYTFQEAYKIFGG